jgi:hypothetical protein
MNGRREIDDSGYGTVRELAVFSKKQGLSLSGLAPSVRLKNYIQILGKSTPNRMKDSYPINSISLLIIRLILYI